MTTPESSKATLPDDMQRLRDIVLGEEKQRLHDLERRVADFESRTDDVAEVLPTAMDHLIDDPTNRPDFERPIVNTIRSAINRDTESFAEVLFPVIGPAIRRAVADALKGLVQRINVALENSFTIKGLKWRLEAAKSGVPFAQVVLRHTMLYAVQEAFLIQRDSGLILASAHRDESLALDEDAVAAMLTAIQSFIQDSFGLTGDEQLSSAELGGRTLWVISGPSAAIACVISGTPPQILRAELMDILEKIHARFGSRLGGSPELVETDEKLQSLMAQTLFEEVDESIEDTSSRSRLMWFAGAAALLLYLSFSVFNVWREQQFSSEVMGLFAAQPGYVITSAEMDDGVLNVNGLRDPESLPPSELLKGQQIAAGRVRTNFSPYQSLDGQVVSARIARRYDIKAPTSLSLDGDELVVSGELSAYQLADLQALPKFHTIIRRINIQAVQLAPDEASTIFRAALQAPDSINFQPVGKQMKVSGEANAEWYSAARQTTVAVPGWQLDYGPVVESLSTQLEQLIEAIDGSEFQFSAGTHLTRESLPMLDVKVAELTRALSFATALGVELTVVLEGFADGVGGLDKNVEISKKRSRFIYDMFIARGASAQAMVQTVSHWDPMNKNKRDRKVKLTVRRGDG